MHFLANLIEYCFSSKKTLVYTTLNQKDYYKVLSLLKSNSIKYRIVTIANSSSMPGGVYSDFGNEYKFYVKKEDEAKALKAIQKKG
ncbi:hypothetical protein [Salinibacillus xinjiangensis]|uniref:DUF2007 domain-containing protein n=1 Tax=Salinibacillus xinjiangensis TaxID=1229268 RepID=A0A6G1X4Z3_9BACI|nr:hypothetical protein [Salinibacillus xinjiangensis]MRG86012.1 hypothetical protein [Salinibacillus xinjiangensis]